MRKLLNIFIIGLAANLGLGVLSAVATLEVSATVQIHTATDFYEPLAAHGAWVEVGSYGRCWHPAHVAVEWRPYCNGSWVWTDCGWYWESDEPWSWACYHYGSWVYDPTYAWIWVPGIEWAPAWVSWRLGGGYVGWAPLPPRGGFVGRVGVVVPEPFVFVEVNRFHEPVRPTTLVINNTTIINKTTQINNIRQETKNIGGTGPQKVMINEGPGLEAIQKATDKKVRVVSIHEAVQQTTVPPAVARKNVEPKTVEPKTVEPKTVEPKTVEPKTVEPKTVEPKTVEPKTVEPKTVEPKTVEPKTVEPKTVEPKTVEPKRERPPIPPPAPPKGEVRPLPERPPAPTVPPGTPRPPPKGKGEGKGHEKERP